MSVWTVCGGCLITAVAAMILGRLGKELIPPLLVAVGVGVILACLPYLAEAVGLIRELGDDSGVGYVSGIIKAVGISYLCSFSTEICRACGEEKLVSYVDTAGKLEILALCVPLFRELYQLVMLK